MGMCDVCRAVLHFDIASFIVIIAFFDGMMPELSSSSEVTAVGIAPLISAQTGRVGAKAANVNLLNTTSCEVVNE